MVLERKQSTSREVIEAGHENNPAAA